MKVLNVFVIHSNHLKYRKNIISSTLKILDEAAKRHVYVFNVTVINTFDLEAVRADFTNIEKDIKAEKTGDEEFDVRISPLNIQKISNFLKQRDALERIVTMKSTDESYYMILEDDAIILPDFAINIDNFLKNPRPSEWDILMLCMSHGGNDILKKTLVDVKILPSKECYCIQPACAKVLLESLKTIKQYYRLQLSIWISANPTIKAMYGPGRVTIEGSKIGLVPSSVNDNNILLYNKDFMTLFYMVSGKETMDLEKATVAFQASEHLNSADLSHLYGVVLFKVNQLKEARIYFEKAVEILESKDGLLTKRSEILNNAININGLCQDDRALYTQSLSKYADRAALKK